MKQYNIDDIRNKIICGDVLEELRKIPDESIDLIITSPPYYGLRDYGIEGQIGLEDTFEEYLEKMLAVTAELKRVLKKTGQCWLNMGDCYASSGSNETRFWHGSNHGKHKLSNDEYSGRARMQNYSAKCLLMQPERLAIRMIDEQGWILRNKVKWCLDEDTKMLIKNGDKYKVVRIKDLKKIEDVKVPALSKEGIKWVNIKDVWFSGKKEIYEIELTNGKKVRASAEHLFPTIVNNARKTFIKLKFKKAEELNKKYDKLYVATKINREGKLKGNYKGGLLVGWYLAEGSGIWTQNPKLTVNEKDLKKLDWLIKKWNLKVKKQKNNNAYDVFLTTEGKGSKKRPLINFLKQFILGKNCSTKRFTDKIWNMSDEFLKGVVEGFCLGDGNWDTKNRRWRIRIKHNPILVEQIEIICLLIGKQFRKENNETAIGFGKKWHISSFSIQNWDKRIKYKNLSFQSIRDVKKIGIRNTYDIEIKPVYTSYCGKGKTTKESIEERKRKWNGIFFLANGILTHNCKQVLIKKENRTIGSVMPTSAHDRFNESGEEFYFFVKNKKYWSDLDAVRLPIQGFTDWTIHSRPPTDWKSEAKFKFNYRVRDAERKKGQPQFRATEEEIKAYKNRNKIADPKKTSFSKRLKLWSKVVNAENSPIKRYQGKFAGTENTYQIEVKNSEKNWKCDKCEEMDYLWYSPYWSLVGEKWKKKILCRKCFLEIANKNRAEMFNSPRARTQRKLSETEKICLEHGYNPNGICPVCGRTWKRHASPNSKDRKAGIKRNFISCIKEYHNKTKQDPNAKGLRQAPEPGEPNAFHPVGKNIPTIWQINPEPHNFKKELELDIEHFACVTPDTEILTIKGWKRYTEIEWYGRKRPKDILVATYNLDKHIIEYQPLIYIKEYDFKGKLIKIGNRDLDILMTPNHRNVVKKRSGEEKIVLAQDLKKFDKIRVSAPIVYPENKGIGKTFAELIGWIIAEGWYIKFRKDEYKRIGISQNEGKKAGRIDYLLKKLEIPYKRWVRKRKYKGTIKKQVEWYLYQSPLTDWVLKNVSNKKLNQFLVSLPIEECRALFRGLIGGDGCIRKADGRISFIQKDKEMHDWFQILAMRLGYHPITTNRITFLTRRKYIGIRKANSNIWIKYQDYQGKVWCPRTSNGTWVARRNGRIFITGNTFPEALVEIPIKFGCPKGGIVLDPFIGSGTTAIVAKKLNRDFIGIDLNPDYVKIARKRIDSIPKPLL